MVLAYRSLLLVSDAVNGRELFVGKPIPLYNVFTICTLHVQRARRHCQHCYPRFSHSARAAAATTDLSVLYCSSISLYYI
jgi:hypothetical protein